MHFCFLVNFTLILISCFSNAFVFADTIAWQTVTPTDYPSSDGPDFTSSSSDAPDSSTNIPDFSTSFSPISTDSTDSTVTSSFPTDTSSSSTFNPSSDYSSTGSTGSTAATSPHPSKNQIVRHKKKKNVLHPRKSAAPAKTKVPDFNDDDSVECKTNSALTVDYRQQISDAHNEFRSILANGMAQLPDGSFASPSSNMYKLKYSCKLEKMAQKWADKESFEHNKNREIPSGENLYWLTGSDGIEDDAINDTSIFWWNELKEYGMISGTNVTYDKGMTQKIGHWSQMAWSSTQFIGCGFKKFPKDNKPDTFYYLTVCNYYPAGNIAGMQIYEIGNSCKKDSECTQKPKSICDVDSGLCYA